MNIRDWLWRNLAVANQLAPHYDMGFDTLVFDVFVDTFDQWHIYIYYVKHLISLEKRSNLQNQMPQLFPPPIQGSFFLSTMRGNSHAELLLVWFTPKWETFSDPSPMANMTFSRRSRHFFCRSNWSASCNNAAAEIFDMAALLAAENRQQEHAETRP